MILVNKKNPPYMSSVKRDFSHSAGIKMQKGKDSYLASVLSGTSNFVTPDYVHHLVFDS